MSINLLIIGMNENILKSIDKINKEINVYIIEEKELFFESAYNNKIKEIKFGEYQQSVQCKEVAIKWSAEIDFNVVIPGREYAVYAANEIAKQLGLKNLGVKASSALTNKYKLRCFLEKSKINQPKFMKITEKKELLEFWENNNRKPFVLKPSNRQSSVGVVLIKKFDEIFSKWEEVTHASEGNKTIKNRKLFWEYQAESLLKGQEVSVETFISKNKIIFNNITKKITDPGDYFIELGHILPGEIDIESEEHLLKSQEELVKELQIEDGLIHSEWIIDENQEANLVECAGRAPGGSIPQLFSLSYEKELFELYINVLIGDLSNFPISAKKKSLLKHFTPKEGEIKKIEGIEKIKELPSLKEIKFFKKEGDIVEKLTDNWKRNGYYIIASDKNDSLKESQEFIDNNLVYLQ